MPNKHFRNRRLTALAVSNRNLSARKFRFHETQQLISLGVPKRYIDHNLDSLEHYMIIERWMATRNGGETRSAGVAERWSGGVRRRAQSCFPGSHPGGANSKWSKRKAGATVQPTNVQGPRVRADCHAPAGTIAWGRSRIKSIPTRTLKISSLCDMGKG